MAGIFISLFTLFLLICMTFLDFANVINWNLKRVALVQMDGILSNLLIIETKKSSHYLLSIKRKVENYDLNS